MLTLRMSGLEKIKAGVTTIERSAQGDRTLGGYPWQSACTSCSRP